MLDAPTILVIEDNDLNRKLFRNLLLIDGYRVLESEDAEQGLTLAAAQQPDLILMDIQLPGMDGLTATRLLKARGETETIPVLALTGLAMVGDDAKALHAGCDGYLTKPIDTRQFRETISRYVRRPCQPVLTLPSHDSPKRPRILIVDDDPLNVKLLTAKLPKDLYETLTAYAGDEALEIVRQSRPDLILLDVMMPGLNGYEVSRQLKADPKTCTIPIILVTALDETEDKIKGFEAGADEFLNKPVNDMELLTRIRSLLRLSHYREKLQARTQPLSPAPGEAQATLAVAEGLPARILLVEDDAQDALLVQSMLKEEAYHLEQVQTGEGALARLREERFDMLLLDVLLPGVDGFDLCNRLKADPLIEDMQIVLITCLSDLENKVRGLELGCDDYLIKPIQGRELRARIKVLIKKKRYLEQLRDDREAAMRAAIFDGLTGLYNQTYFKRFLDLEIKRAIRQKYPVALVMVDLDNFKQINDSLGHLVGDVVLKEVAQLVKANVREMDLSARYGGDEFVVVLPYAAQAEVRHLVGRLQTLLKQWGEGTAKPAECPPVSLSIGVAFYPDHGATAEALIHKADEALYRAKREGRNRCYFGEGESVDNLAV